MSDDAAKPTGGHAASMPPGPAAALANILRWAGLLGILSIAVMRCLVFFAPSVLFDTDPVSDPTPLIGLGAAGSLFLDAALLLSCAAALLGEWIGGRGLNWLVLLLALIPMPIVLWHGSRDAGDLWLGGTWLAAAVACATMAHLGRDRSMRIAAISILLAAVSPMVARSALQVFHEHAATVAMFEQEKDRLLRDHGWEPGSAAALIFERRLRQAQPTAWFATSNIVASFMAIGLVLAIGLALAAARARMQSGWAGAMTLLAMACAAVLWLTGSKGAAIAAIAGLMMLCLPLLPGVAERIGRRAGVIAVGFVALALIGVIVRGAILPEGFLGDKSLLFRWHYMAAAAGIFSEHALLGVGPDGFQAAYTLHRLPRNPEEVMSAHSMFIDWACTLGLTGLAWAALALSRLWRAGAWFFNRAANSGEFSRSAGSRNAFDTKPAYRRRLALRCASIVAALGMLPAMWVEWPALDGVGLLVRVIGMVGFVAVAAIAAEILEAGEARLLGWAAAAGVAALAIHGQIEMTFVQPGAAAWGLCMIGVIGGVCDRRGRTIAGATAGLLCIAATAFASAWIVFNGALPATRQQQAMTHAATLLAPLREPGATDEQFIMLRQAAANALVDAYNAWPINVHPLNAAATQLELACARDSGPTPLGLLMQAKDLIQKAIAGHDRASSIISGIGINMRLALATGDAEYWQAAIDLARRMMQRDPNGLGSWKRLGDVLWAAGQKPQAAEAYRTALECDANFELDELKQLTPKQREVIQNRIKEAPPS